MRKEYMTERENNVNTGTQGNRFRGTVFDYLKPDRSEMVIALIIPLCFLLMIICAGAFSSGPKTVRTNRRTSNSSAVPGLCIFIIGQSILVIHGLTERDDYKKYMAGCDSLGLSGEMEDDFRSGRPLGHSMVLGEKYLFVRHGCCAIPYGDIRVMHYSVSHSRYSTSGMYVYFLQRWRNKRYVKITEGSGWMNRERDKWAELVREILEYNPYVAFDLDELRKPRYSDDDEWDWIVRLMKEKTKDSICKLCR